MDTGLTAILLLAMFVWELIQRFTPGKPSLKPMAQRDALARGSDDDPSSK